MSRPKLPDSIRNEVIEKSRRRCSICFYLNLDSNIKKGQFAHIDHDPTNNCVDNIVFLCLNHHDEYDSGTSQSASISTVELKKYRDELYRFIGDEIASAASNTTNLRRPTTSYWAFKQGPTRAEIETALAFYAGPHRTRGVLRMLEEGPKTIGIFKNTIPGDPEWVFVIVSALVTNGYAHGPIGDNSEFRISSRGERMLRILDEIPEFIKKAWWDANWKLVR